LAIPWSRSEPGAERTMNDPNRFYRITALWVISETFVGGVLHAVRMPLTGIVLAGLAVFWMCLLRHQTGRAESILRALVLVMIFKMLLSPHAPLGAFLSVGLQGLAGYLVFRFVPGFRVGAYALALFAYVQSALMRVVTLTVIFGMGFWEAVDVFVAQILAPTGVEPGVSWAGVLVAAYLALYVGGGVVAGYLCARIPQWYEPLAPTPEGAVPEEVERPEVAGRRRPRWLVPLGGAALLIGVSFVPILPDGFRAMLLRGGIILLVWFTVVAPLLRIVLFRWLRKRGSRLSGEIQAIAALLPEAERIVVRAWRQSAAPASEGRRRWIWAPGGVARLSRFLQLTVRYSL